MTNYTRRAKKVEGHDRKNSGAGRVPVPQLSKFIPAPLTTDLYVEKPSPVFIIMLMISVRVCARGLVLTVDKTDCSGPLNARLPAGRIASITAHESRCTPRYDATWIIRAQPGQRINISLLDFNAAAHLGRRIPAASAASKQTELAPVCLSPFLLIVCVELHLRDGRTDRRKTRTTTTSTAIAAVTPCRCRCDS